MVLAIAVTSLFAVGCSEKSDEVKADGMIELNTWHFTSGVPNNLITVRHSDKNAIFECLADDGEFRWNNEYSQTVQIAPDDTVYWHPNNLDQGKEKTFVDIILTVDGNISGYAVIKIACRENGSWADADATVVKSVFIKAENISCQEVEQRIENLKK
ncbi:MAG: hypothetical protein IJY62_01980 [Clostridia bacterium]|nr:hypothetical protein [Clostridia bacterium]